MKGVLLILFVVITSDCVAWGATGHRATGHIAEQYLSSKTRKKLAAIMGQESLAIASNWMDDIRSDTAYRHATTWHYTTIPDGKKYEGVAANPDGKIVEMIEKFISDLKGRKLSKKKELEELKMLIHLVGDIHQPLHVGRPGDRGGNDVKLKWFRGESNLHRVWDSEMIDGSQLSYTELAASLGKPDQLTVKKWQSASVRDWAHESMTYREQVYAIGDGSLSYEYTYTHWAIVKQRVLQAGIRLAGVLNQIYGK